MYCAGCGTELGQNDLVCAKCGRPSIAPAAPRATLGEEYRFARTVRRLGLFYALFAGLNIALVAVGWLTLRAGWLTSWGPWEPWPHPPLMAWTYLGAGAWIFLVIRAAFAVAAWDALRTRSAYGRAVAIVAGVVAFTQFPIGLLLGAYTIVSLAGKRGATLYGRLIRP
jgi:hypothetical protein